MSDHLLRLKQLLNNYLHNTISPDELDELWQLLEKLPENDLVDLQIAGLWNDPALNRENGVDWERVYSRLQSRMHEPNMDYTRLMRPRKGRWKGLAIAASLLFAIAVSSYLFTSLRKATPAGIVSTRRNPGLQLLRLSDGTSVTLNQNSRLEYPKTFNGATREVVLYGEAFFDVHHDSSRPFMVHTANLVVRVLGTAFNIKSYDMDEKIAVTVSRGKVQVQRKSNQKILGMLTAGEQLLVDKNAGVALQNKVDVKGVLVWKTILDFDNKTVGEAAAIISSYFGVEIKFDNEALRSCRFTADLSENENDLSQVMNVITLLTGSTWTKNENIIRISGKGCV